MRVTDGSGGCRRSPPGRLLGTLSPPARLLGTLSPPRRLLGTLSPPRRLLGTLSPPGRLLGIYQPDGSAVDSGTPGLAGGLAWPGTSASRASLTDVIVCCGPRIRRTFR